MRLFILENLTGVRTRGIERKPVGEHERHRMDRAIGILDHTAAHAAGVVGKDAAHHAGVDGGGVGTDAASVRLQRHVDESAHDTGLEADVFRIVFNAVFPPMFGNVHKDSVSNSLARETGPCGAEGHGNFVLLGELEKGLDLAD